MIFSPDIAHSLEADVTSTHAEFAATMASGYWMFVSSTNCWIKQGSPTATIVCDTNANMADGDTVTIADGTTTKIYEYDKADDDVAGGHVTWAAGTTAASVATNLAAAINAHPPNATVVATASGATVTVTSTTGNLTTTKSSASGMTVAYTPIATKATGSMFVPALATLYLDGSKGSNLSVLRDSADGKASLTPTFRF